MVIYLQVDMHIVAAGEDMLGGMHVAGVGMLDFQDML